MKETKNVYAFVYSLEDYDTDITKTRVLHVLESDYLTAIKKHRESGIRFGDNWVLRSVNLLAENVDY